MSRKYRQQSTRILNPSPTETKLPLDRPVANYYRQSSEGQIGNISTTIQTLNMAAYLERLGWDKSDIIMIDTDAGVSGTTRIDERQGMKHLYGLIIEQKIGAVACQDEDRLFRDETQIQVNMFIEACKSNHVLVITPSMIYDFAHRTYGTFHARQFRFKCEMAAEYINSIVLGRLYDARRNMFLEGRWAGSSVPTGYMVDMRRTLPDSSKNENWRRYEVFEPYAAVVREYFRLFLSYSGNLTKTLFHIREKGPYYPDPSTCVPPEGYKVLYRIRPNRYGWCPKSKGALANMFSNALYLGHFVFGEAIVRWNNHPPLIDENTFLKAFNYLSMTDLEGNENPHFTPDRRNHRPSKEENRTVDYPLLSGLLFGEREGEWKPVSTQWRSQWQTYDYAFYVQDGFTTPLWRKSARFIDDAVTALMLDKLKSTLDFDAWETAVATFNVSFEVDKRLKEAQLQQLQAVMENYVVSLGSLNSPQLIAAVEKKYLHAQTEYDRLQAELETIKAEEVDIQRIKEILNVFSDAPDNWEFMTADEKRYFCRIFIDRIETTKTGSGTIRITIYWKDDSVDTLHINRVTSRGTRWLPQEITRLVELMESGASKLDIAKEFPERKWKDIYYKYKYTVKQGSGYRYEGTIRKDESYNEYIKRVGLPVESSGSSENSSQRTLYCVCTPSMQAA